MNLKRFIPNFITLLNLLAGIIAVMYAVTDNLLHAVFFVLLGIFFDFFDGLAARLLNVQSELGKQLDSLADVVTSGVAPGLIMFQLLSTSLKQNWLNDLSCEVGTWVTFDETPLYYLPFVGLLIPLASAYRLAKFNIDERHSDSFIGLPTPANTLFVLSLPLIVAYSNCVFIIDLIGSHYFLLAITLIGSILMNVDIKMFALKFKNLSFKENTIQYLFLLISIILLITLQFVAIPLIIILYVILSLFSNYFIKKV